MFRIKNSIVKKIGITIFIFVLLVFVIYYNFLNVQIKTYLEQQGKEQLRNESEYLCAEIESYLQKYTVIVEQAKMDPDFINIAKEIDNRYSKRENSAYAKISEELSDICSLDDNIAQAYIALGSANDLITNIYDVDMSSGYDLSKRQWYVDTIAQNRTTISPPYVDLITNKPAITISAPLIDNDEVYGAFGLDILIEDINSIMDECNLEIESSVGLVYNNGRILYNPNAKDADETDITYIQDTLSQELTKDMLSGQSGVAQYTDQGQEKYIAYLPVKDSHIIVYNEILRSKILAPINRFIFVNLLILIVIIILLLVGVSVLEKFFSSPLIMVCKQMQNFTNGRAIQLPQKIKDRNDEIGVLGSGFIFMTDKISNYILTLEQKNQELYDAKETINKERLRFKTTLRSLGDGVISTDDKGNIQIMNDAAENLTGWNKEDAAGLPFEKIFHIINENTGENAMNPVKRVLEKKEEDEIEENILLIKKNGEELPIEECTTPILDDTGNIAGVVIVFRDYSVKKEKQAEISYLSYHDQLTGLNNRHFFEKELKTLEKECYLPLSLALIDVNGLKLTNDAFGHQVGDKLLQIIAETLKISCRKNDMICRIGGDEFILLLPKTDEDVVERIMERINLEIGNLSINNTIISVSIGWDTKRSSEHNIMDVYAKAEEIMYRKKLTESQKVKKKTIQAIVKTLHENNEREKVHSKSVGEISRKIGEELRLDQEILREVELTGILHDIGKVALDSMLLKKPGKLTDSEYEIVKRHAETGYHILKSVDAYANLSEYVLAHHEHWDGTGYPRGLKGAEIPLVSRIIMVAGAYEAMTGECVYRKALSKEEAIQELIRCSGKQFDPFIVEAFVNILRNQA